MLRAVEDHIARRSELAQLPRELRVGRVGIIFRLRSPTRIVHLLIQDNVACLRAGEELLSKISPDLYTRCFSEGGGASIGEHFRHNLEHYGCFLDGLRVREIDYDARRRELQYSSDPHVAAEGFAAVREAVAELDTSEGDFAVRVQMDAGSNDAGDCWSQSSVRRELQFLLSHTVHHYAIIATLCRIGGYEPGSDFGVAPSTLRHRAAVTS